MSGQPILQVSNVTKKFRNLVAVDQVSFDIFAGDIVGLIGPNGAGKTTLFNVVTGLERATAGKITFKETDITSAPPYDICSLGMSRTFQIAQTFSHMTVREAVRVGAYNRCGEADVVQKVDEVVALCHLEEIQNHKCSDLSLALLRRVELARAIATGADLLLLDEAGAGLTAPELAQLMTLLKHLNAEIGISFCVVEHVMKMVMGLCPRIVVLDSGVKIAEGTPDEIRRDPDVIEAYLGKRVLA